MDNHEILEIPIRGMDCADCTMHVKRAIAALPGVDSVEVFLASEKAVVSLDPQLVDLPGIRKAVAGAGYSVPEAEGPKSAEKPSDLRDFSRTYQIAGHDYQGQWRGSTMLEIEPAGERYPIYRRRGIVTGDDLATRPVAPQPCGQGRP